jgi:hypothetical protein
VVSVFAVVVVATSHGKALSELVQVTSGRPLLLSCTASFHTTGAVSGRVSWIVALVEQAPGGGSSLTQLIA